MDKKIFIQKILKLSPFILFLPFLFLYAGIVFLLHNDAWTGDELRYYQFAKNLLQGFYSPPAPDINLWNGPGYPIFILPFVALQAPLILITLANSMLQYLSVVFLYKGFKKIVSPQKSLFFGLFWALYFISWQEMSYLHTETLASFCICLFIYGSLSFLKGERKYIHGVIAGFALGWLTLTKIIFGYVLFGALLFFGVFYLFSRKQKSQKVMFILVVAFVMTLPYLIYTKNLTGKNFYWGNSGGMSLYWMSTPFENEFGDWNRMDFTSFCGFDAVFPCNADLYAKNHKQDMEFLRQFEGVERDDAFKKIAWKNIQKHPVKYLRNCVSNFSRLLFGIPYSYFSQKEKTVIRFPLNSVILSLIFFCLPLTLFNWRKKIPLEVKFLLIILGGYLFLTLLVSTYPRMFYVAVPLLLIWFAYIFEKCVNIRWSID